MSLSQQQPASKEILRAYLCYLPSLYRLVRTGPQVAVLGFTVPQYNKLPACLTETRGINVKDHQQLDTWLSSSRDFKLFSMARENWPEIITSPITVARTHVRS